MDECIDSLELVNVFPPLDANSGYWQIKRNINVMDKTAFVTQNGLYGYNRMHFGLKNAPATFKLVNEPARDSFCRVDEARNLPKCIMFSLDYETLTLKVRPEE